VGNLLKGITALGRKDVMDRLYRLDAIITPGVGRAEFVALFAECTVCGLVMTRRAFQSHECVMPERTLTLWI